MPVLGGDSTCEGPQEVHQRSSNTSGSVAGMPNGENKWPVYRMSEVSEHSWKHARKWVVIRSAVYDITNWLYKHPGGPWVLKNYAGQDGTTAFLSFHKNLSVVEKYMKLYQIGVLDEEDRRALQETPIAHDFADLTKKAHDMGLFQTSYFFYVCLLLHIILLEVVGFWVLCTIGYKSWVGYLLSAVFLTSSQAQAGWLQHDFGHLSVFKSSRMNHVAHKIIIGFVKGAATSWWNWRHFRHHSKPNVVVKDPDITFPELFIFGRNFPVLWAKKHKQAALYHWQHFYFFFLGPPMLLPVYFHYEITRHIIKYKQWMDLALIFLFLVRFIGIASYSLGLWGAVGLYMFVRFLESHWFTWATQMSHIPMHVSYDEKQDWPTLQTRASTNVSPTAFTSWWSGHLNYQIEHHLFPTMPRHNFRKIAPLVRDFCEKHHLPYTVKNTFRAFADIVVSMRDSGELWYNTFYEM